MHMKNISLYLNEDKFWKILEDTVFLEYPKEHREKMEEAIKVLKNEVPGGMPLSYYLDANDFVDVYANVIPHKYS